MKRITRADVLKEAQRFFNSKAGGGNEMALMSLCILIAAATQGTTDADKIARFMKFPYRPVRERVRRARENGIFIGHKINGSEWFDKDGGVALLLDGAVLDGYLVKK